jgi:predicted lipoprotein
VVTPRPTTLACCLVLVSWFFPTIVHAEADHAGLAKATLENYIRPGYAQLSESAATLSGKAQALCAQPSAAALKDARAALAGEVEAWSKVEPLRFGPVAQEHRYERLFYWPDPKGLGLRQVRDALAKQDGTVTKPEGLAAKSVALQGLPALEFLLYGDDSDTLAKGGGDAAFRCGFAASVAANVASIAKEIDDGWKDGAPFTKSYLAPGPDDPFYRAPKEVTLELFKAFTTGIESVRDQKLAKMLGAKPEEAKPELAPFWRSGLTLTNIADNLDGVRQLFQTGGFAELVHSDSPGVENSTVFDLDHAIEVLHGIDLPVAKLVHDEIARGKLEALRVSLKGAAQTASDIISRVAGLAFGFNAMDSD